MKKYRLGLFLSLALIFAMPAMAQNKTPFQGNWLGFVCGQGEITAISYSINGDSTKFHRFADSSGLYTMDSAGAASYQISKGKTVLYSNNGTFKFIFHINSDNKLIGTMNGNRFEFSGGPDSDLKRYYIGYGSLCKIR